MVGVRLRRDQGVIHGECIPNEPTLARAMRFALQPDLLEQGWLMLHGCSAVIGGLAHVFVAPSGTGKSTLLRRLMEAGFEPLGDEVALVGHGSCTVFPYQPCAGRNGTTVKLGGLHWLGQGGPSSRRLSRARALSLLLGQTMVYEEDSRAAGLALDVLGPLVEQVPAYETNVPDDDRAVFHAVQLAEGQDR